MTGEELAELNKPEPKADIIKRLTAEADRGIVCAVTAVEALEFRREQYGLAIVEFSVLLGLNKSHYSDFVSGKRSLPPRAMRRAAAIGIPCEVLLQHPRVTDLTAKV